MILLMSPIVDENDQKASSLKALSQIPSKLSVANKFEYNSVARYRILQIKYSNIP